MNTFISWLFAYVLILGSLGPAQDYVGSARQFVIDLSQRHFEDAAKQFDEKMAKALPPKKLKETWDGLLDQVGPFKKIEKTRSQEAQGYHVVYVSCAFARADLDAKVVFNDEGRIGGLFFVPPQSSSSPSDWGAPAYVQPVSFHELSVTVGGASWQLPGVLAIPM